MKKKLKIDMEAAHRVLEEHNIKNFDQHKFDDLPTGKDEDDGISDIEAKSISGKNAGQ